jgi:hypothetical protein
LLTTSHQPPLFQPLTTNHHNGLYWFTEAPPSFSIIRRGERRRCIPRLLDALDRGEPMDKAFMATYGITLGQFVEGYNAVSPI